MPAYKPRPSDSLEWKRKKYAHLKKVHPNKANAELQQMVNAAWKKEAARRRKAGGLPPKNKPKTAYSTYKDSLRRV